MRSFSPLLLGVLALAAVADTTAIPLSGTVGQDGQGRAPAPDALPPTREQASLDFRRSPGGRAKARWKNKRRGAR